MALSHQEDLKQVATDGGISPCENSEADYTFKSELSWDEIQRQTTHRYHRVDQATKAGAAYAVKIVR